MLAGTCTVLLWDLPVRLFQLVLLLDIPADFHVVVWTKSNPTPWNTIGADHGTKLLEVNQKFDRRYAESPALFKSINKPPPAAGPATSGSGFALYSFLY